MCSRQAVSRTKTYCIAKKKKRGAERELHLIEETENLSTSVAGTGFLVIHDTKGSREHHKAKLTAGKNVLHPLFEVRGGAVKAGADGAALVEAAVEIHHNFTRAVIVDNLKLANVTVLLHHLQKLHDDLGGWTNKNLTLATALRARNTAKRVGQHAHHRHFLFFPDRYQMHNNQVNNNSSKKHEYRVKINTYIQKAKARRTMKEITG
ncbi:hypothetical protein TCSYLVIO_007646 [Trypanosoma cruzi]|nr:hypothetical protein TCSYLVIO_007646 [Trypanosoma cruzi]